MSLLIASIAIVILEVLFIIENKRRDVLRAQAEATGEGLHHFDEYAIIETVDQNGNTIKTKVEKSLLDITDKENLAFRYAL